MTKVQLMNEPIAEEWAATFNSIDDLVSIHDRNFRIVRVNNAFAAMLKMKPEELIGRICYEVIHGTKEPWPTCPYKRALDTRKSVCDEFFEPNLGIYLQVTASPMFNKEGKLFGAVHIAKNISERKEAEENLKQSLDNFRKAMEGTIKAMALTVETRDPYTAGHQRRVTDLVCAIAETMNLPKDQIHGIRMASLIHDIGKIYVPAEVLAKPASLTETEFTLFKAHPKVGYEILRTVEFPWPVAKIVLQHHERMDGSGYPAGLSGEGILLEARILAVADVVEAMSSHRPYRPALGIKKALEEISQNKGVLYDSKVVDACLKLFRGNRFKF